MGAKERFSGLVHFTAASGLGLITHGLESYPPTRGLIPEMVRGSVFDMVGVYWIAASQEVIFGHRNWKWNAIAGVAGIGFVEAVQWVMRNESTRRSVINVLGKDSLLNAFLGWPSWNDIGWAVVAGLAIIGTDAVV